MTKERKHTGEIQATTLPVPDFNAFCGELYKEGLAYNHLREDEVEKAGTITSILLHDYPEREGRWISLHFRESLESLANIKTPVARAKAFLINLGEDLHLLSERLAEDLGDVDMIYGLTQLSASWGRRHGFTTVQFTPDPEVIRNHCLSITGMPPQTNDQAPLTLFSFERKAFIQEFYIEDSDNPKAPEGEHYKPIV